MRSQPLKGGIFTPERGNKRFGFVREADLPKIISRAGMVGFMGSDTFESLPDNQPDTLNFRAIAKNGVRIVLATRQGETIPKQFRIATSYPRIARRMLVSAGLDFQIVCTVGGSVEAMPYLIDGVNAVVDVVKEGKTMAANGLFPIMEDSEPVMLGMVWMKSPDTK